MTNPFPAAGSLLNHVFSNLTGDASLRMSTWMGRVGDWLNSQAGGTPGQALVKNSGTDGDFGYVDLAPLSDAVPMVPTSAGQPGLSGEASRSDHQHPPNNAGTVTGSRGGNAALASLLTALDSAGVITNSTTA